MLVKNSSLNLEVYKNLFINLFKVLIEYTLDFIDFLKS